MWFGEADAWFGGLPPAARLSISRAHVATGAPDGDDADGWFRALSRDAREAIRLAHVATRDANRAEIIEEARAGRKEARRARKAERHESKRLRLEAIEIGSPDASSVDETAATPTESVPDDETSTCARFASATATTRANGAELAATKRRARAIELRTARTAFRDAAKIALTDERAVSFPRDGALAVLDRPYSRVGSSEWRSVALVFAAYTEGADESTWGALAAATAAAKVLLA